MRILDEKNSEIAPESIDYSTHKLVEDRHLVAHHKAQDAIEEVSYYETIKEYENGGKDVERVIFQEAQEACEAWDEYEDIYRLVPLSEKELAEMRIAELKAYLSETDFAIMKIAEGVATPEKYADILSERGKAREEINRLEGVMIE